MNVTEAIKKAEKLLPGKPAKENEIDPRWQVIIIVSEFIKSNPREIWNFIKKWGSYKDQDLQSAIGTCLLEHLLEHHFDYAFDKVKDLSLKNRNFANTFLICSEFGESTIPKNSKKFDQLKNKL